MRSRVGEVFIIYARNEHRKEIKRRRLAEVVEEWKPSVCN